MFIQGNPEFALKTGRSSFLPRASNIVMPNVWRITNASIVVVLCMAECAAMYDPSMWWGLCSRNPVPVKFNSGIAVESAAFGELAISSAQVQHSLHSRSALFGQLPEEANDRIWRRHLGCAEFVSCSSMHMFQSTGVRRPPPSWMEHRRFHNTLTKTANWTKLRSIAVWNEQGYRTVVRPLRRARQDNHLQPHVVQDFKMPYSAVDLVGFARPQFQEIVRTFGFADQRDCFAVLFHDRPI